MAVGVAAAAVSLPLALAARRPDVAGRVPAVKRAELERGAAAPGRIAKPRVVRAVRGPGWRQGIVATGLAPFSESAYRIVNQWQDVVGGEHVNVYAGQLGLSPRRGAVVVQRTPVTGASPGPAVAYVAPGDRGALRITRARGTVLELQSADGGRYVFDVRRASLVAIGRGRRASSSSGRGHP